jgi:hypothetical protein
MVGRPRCPKQSVVVCAKGRRRDVMYPGDVNFLIVMADGLLLY